VGAVSAADAVWAGRPPAFREDVSPATAAVVRRVAAAVLRALAPCAGPWHVVFRPNGECVVACTALPEARLRAEHLAAGTRACGTATARAEAWVEWRPEGALLCTQFLMVVDADH
jgi:hypothetical protein